MRAPYPETVGQIRDTTNGHYALGNERFQKEIEVMLGRRASKGQSGRQSKETLVDARQEVNMSVAGNRGLPPNY